MAGKYKIGIRFLVSAGQTIDATSPAGDVHPVRRCKAGRWFDEVEKRFLDWGEVEYDGR